MPRLTSTDSIQFLEGVSLFNAQSFFECHEVLENLWRPLTPGPEKEFLQGLIQIAVGLHHLQHRNFRGAQSLLEKGLARLNRENVCNQTWPVDLKRLITYASGLIQELQTTKHIAFESLTFPLLKSNTE